MRDELLTLLLQGDRYVIAKPDSTEPADVDSIWVMEKFTRELVIIHRTDGPNAANGAPQLKFDYTGQLSAASKSLVNITLHIDKDAFWNGMASRVTSLLGENRRGHY